MKMSVDVSVTMAALLNMSMKSAAYLRRWVLTGDNDCDVEAFISPPEEDHVNVIMTLFGVTNAKATLTLSLFFGRWKKC